jgi:hypothetical protein
MRFIAALTVMLAFVTVGGAVAQTRPAPTRPVPATAVKARRPVAPFSRGFVSANGGFQVTQNDFDDGETFREHGEDARYSTDYTVQGGPTIDVAGGMRIWRQLAVGAGVTRFSRSTPVTLNGSVPHPFFFSRPRSVNGEISNVKRQELAVHVQARAVVPVNRRMQVMVFGGPSFFQVKQGIVTELRYSESYPYDSASFASAATTDAKESKIGLNVGGDFAYFFTRQIGVGVSAQFSGTEVDVPNASGQTQKIKVGGFQTGGGLRLRF